MSMKFLLQIFLSERKISIGLMCSCEAGDCCEKC